jgi:predicted ribosomally synthesized peptide with SipW-like signal peptide
MRKPELRSLIRDTRVRAALSLGVVAALGAGGTFAYWTDSSQITGTTFSTGMLDLKASVDGTNFADNPTNSGTLTMTAMAPGNTSAQVLTIKNAGTVPLKWTLAANLTGTNASDFDTANALTVLVKTGATISGSGNSATCSGGTQVGVTTTLKQASGTIVTTPQPTTAGSGLGAAGTVALCFQVSFDANAPTTLQTKTTQATFTFSATSNIS